MAEDILKKKCNVRSIGIIIFTGLLISFCYAAGASLEARDTVNLTETSFYLRWLAGAIPAGIMVVLLWGLADKVRSGIGVNCRLWRLADRIEIPLWGNLLILLACWIPAWLSIWPGAFSYDAYDEWNQIYTGEITAHHPVLHVLLLGGLTEGLHRLTGSYNVGIAVYTGVQMFLLAFVLAYTLEFLKERKINKAWQLFALLFYALSPVIQLYSICATKDTLFAAAALLWFISLWRLVQQEELFWKRKSWQWMFGLSALFTMIMRNNGLYIVVLTLLLALLLRKNSRKRLLKISLLILVPYLVYIGPFYRILNVVPGGVEEMLSVPIQQIARVHYYEPDSIASEDLEILYSIIPEENWNAYRVSVSDFVKAGFVEEEFEAYKLDFFRIWAELGMEHPLTYVNSFLLGNVDFWYPHAVMDGYRDVYGRSSYFDYQVSEPGTEVVILEKLHQFYERISWDKEAQKSAGAFLILSPGWYFMMAFVVAMYLWYRREYGKMLPMSILVWNMLTVFLGPIALVRYVLILFLVFPLYGVILQQD